MARHADSDRIEDEASLWAARLEGGNMTDADRAALGSWLRADPEHREVLARYRQLSAQLDDQLAAAAESLAIHVAGVRRRRARRWGVTLAAAAAVALGVTIWTLRPEEFSTGTGERHLATLADGSRVELNAQTELSVKLKRDERRVRLAHGEALFTVAKDPARPFFVDTLAGTVRVTGTVFNVRTAHAAGERAEVTVLEGHVRVRAAGDAAADDALTPNQQAVLNNGLVATKTLASAATQGVVAWREGYAVFDETPLRDAVERFAAYHARALTVDPSVAGLPLGGRYALDDLDGFLEALPKFLAVSVVRESGGAVRIAAR